MPALIPDTGAPQRRTLPFPDLVLRFRRVPIVAVHVLLIWGANSAAFWLRFDGDVPAWASSLQWRMLPWLVLIRGLAFVPFRLYEGLWRYTSIWDLNNILLGVGTSSALFWAVSRWLFGGTTYPRSIYLVDALLLVCFMAAIRLARRVQAEMERASAGRTVLVYGAGDAGEMIVRDMRRRSSDLEPIGFVDDDPSKTGMRIHGVPVLGTREDLARILADRRPQEVLVAIPSANPELMRGIVRALEPFKIAIKTLPNVRAILDGTVTVEQIRNLAVEDLLSRPPVGLARKPVSHLLAGRRVLVTGAGGSIGSELCRQILRYGPGALVLYERYENGLYEVATRLRDRGHHGDVHAVLGDITDVSRLDATLREHRPEIVFHAAAHKHVPLMEDNACEAVKNNVMGTRLVAEAAERHGVDRFILISTDKAVNPTSVMGATKRVAELFLHMLGQGSGTSFYTVRFGNVLASQGSVVPRFLEQIKARRPVTVTHPDMRRYFMLIPEAVELVLHAAAQGKPGDIYVLKMGEQIPLVDMARNLIRLAGFVPDEDIPIEFTGIRPGEKLYEELVGPEEVIELSGTPEIMRVQPLRVPAADTLTHAIEELERRAKAENVRGVLEQLRVIVPEFQNDAPAPREAIERLPAQMAVAQTSRPPEHLRCPACQSLNIHRSRLSHRSRLNSLAERFRRKWTKHRPYRCHDCNWRGWLVPLTQAHVHVEGLAGDRAEADAVDLTSIDAAVQDQPRPARPAFSPRSLR